MDVMKFDLDKAKAEIGHLVVNMRVQGARWDVRIDRQTRWGNPFKGPNRRENVLNYLHWLRDRVRSDDITIEELAELHGKRLACWCSPLDCHGHVLAWAARRCWEFLNRKAA